MINTILIRFWQSRHDLGLIALPKTEEDHMYAVIQPDSPTYGLVISRHLAMDAARRAIEKERRVFAKSKRHTAGSYLDREIAECGTRATRVRRQTISKPDFGEA